jgi:hypothetical protein
MAMEVFIVSQLGRMLCNTSNSARRQRRFGDDAGQHTLAVVHIAHVDYTDISSTPLNCRSRYVMASRGLAIPDIPERQPKVAADLGEHPRSRRPAQWGCMRRYGRWSWWVGPHVSLARTISDVDEIRPVVDRRPWLHTRGPFGRASRPSGHG